MKWISFQKSENSFFLAHNGLNHMTKIIEKIA
jgi:hypothetical protein